MQTMFIFSGKKISQLSADGCDTYIRHGGSIVDLLDNDGLRSVYHQIERLLAEKPLPIQQEQRFVVDSEDTAPSDNPGNDPAAALIGILQKRGMSHRAIADMVGVSCRQIGHVFNGEYRGSALLTKNLATLVEGGERKIKRSRAAIEAQSLLCALLSRGSGLSLAKIARVSGYNPDYLKKVLAGESASVPSGFMTRINRAVAVEQEA